MPQSGRIGIGGWSSMSPPELGYLSSYTKSEVLKVLIVLGDLSTTWPGPSHAAWDRAVAAQFFRWRRLNRPIYRGRKCCGWVRTNLV